MDELKELINNVIMWVFLFCCLFMVVIPLGKWLGGSDDFRGYYADYTPDVSKRYRISVSWADGMDTTAFATEDVNIFFRACDYFKVKINKDDVRKAVQKSPEEVKRVMEASIPVVNDDIQEDTKVGGDTSW